MSKIIIKTIYYQQKPKSNKIKLDLTYFELLLIINSIRKSFINYLHYSQKYFEINLSLKA